METTIPSFISNDRWPHITDETFASLFAALKTSIQRWTAESVIKDELTISNLFARMPVQSLTLLNDVMVEKDRIPSSLKNTHGPAVLLSALLAHDVCVNVVAEPFPLHEKFRLIYDEIKHDRQLANRWRSDTLRLFQETVRLSTNDKEKLLLAGGPLSDRLNHLALQRAERFYSGPASALMGPLTDDGARMLTKIYYDAEMIGQKFWTQRSDMAFCTVDNLSNKLVVKSEREPEVEVHKLLRHNVGAYWPDGKKIEVMTWPIIAACGDEMGEGYDELRLLASAEVWVEGVQLRAKKVRFELKTPPGSVSEQNWAWGDLRNGYRAPEKIKKERDIISWWDRASMSELNALVDEMNEEKEETISIPQPTSHILYPNSMPRPSSPNPPTLPRPTRMAAVNLTAPKEAQTPKMTRQTDRRHMDTAHCIMRILWIIFFIALICAIFKRPSPRPQFVDRETQSPHMNDAARYQKQHPLPHPHQEREYKYNEPIPFNERPRVGRPNVKRQLAQDEERVSDWWSEEFAFPESSPMPRKKEKGKTKKNANRCREWARNDVFARQLALMEEEHQQRLVEGKRRLEALRAKLDSDEDYWWEEWLSS